MSMESLISGSNDVHVSPDKYLNSTVIAQLPAPTPVMTPVEALTVATLTSSDDQNKS